MATEYQGGDSNGSDPLALSQTAKLMAWVGAIGLLLGALRAFPGLAILMMIALVPTLALSRRFQERTQERPPPLLFLLAMWVTWTVMIGVGLTLAVLVAMGIVCGHFWIGGGRMF